MDYELVKRLEAAGYPVSTPDIPDLEELLEACSLNGSRGVWLSREWKEELWTASSYKGAKIIRAVYPTPVEAVAHLWLELNTSKYNNTV